MHKSRITSLVNAGYKTSAVLSLKFSSMLLVDPTPQSLKQKDSFYAGKGSVHLVLQSKID